uniref:Down syndrome cell adhesion molecule-like protein Dscam2 n=1 Tax=Cacopsylla melanoneura TaxID=428564 RepID=A0A8D9B6K2_9HEMI
MSCITVTKSSHLTSALTPALPPPHPATPHTIIPGKDYSGMLDCSPPFPRVWLFPFSISFTTLLISMFLVQPQIEPFAFNQQGMNGGGSLKILCTVSSGDPPFEMSWLKGAAPLVSSSSSRRSQRLDDTTLMLTFSQLSLDDAGNYTCLVSSPAGNTSHFSTLQVKGTGIMLYKSLIDVVS